MFGWLFFRTLIEGKLWNEQDSKSRMKVWARLSYESPNRTKQRRRKRTRHRDAFIKYNEGGKVDIDGLEQVFVDMKLTVPDSEDLQETIEHYSKGGEGVNHEQFSELLDLLRIR